MADDEKKRPPSTHWERQQKVREEKLKDIADAVEEGSLVIRQMTPEERKENPPKPPRERGSGRGFRR